MGFVGFMVFRFKVLGIKRFQFEVSRVCRTFQFFLSV